MPIPFLDNLNLNQNELQNAIAQSLGSAPGTPKPGQFYYDSGNNVIKFWNGSAWVPVDAAKSSNIPLSALAGIANATLLGNNTGASGAPIPLTATQVKALLSIAADDVSGLTAAIEAIRLDQFAAPTAAVSLNSQRITNLGAPSATTDAATKAYVDAQAQAAAAGLDPKESVAAASTANLTLSGIQAVDGVAGAAGMRVLVKNQTAAAENGLYTMAAGAWQRTPDGVQGQLTSGALVFVENGNTTTPPQAATQWYLQTPDPITVGTTALTWTQFSAGANYSADANGGLQLTGSAFGVKLPASSGLVADATGLRVDTTVIARKYAATIGDGSSVAIVVTHNLNTQDVTVSLRNVATPYAAVLTSWEATSANTITLRFASAPASNSLRCVVTG